MLQFGGMVQWVGLCEEKIASDFRALVNACERIKTTFQTPKQSQAGLLSDGGGGGGEGAEWQ